MPSPIDPAWGRPHSELETVARNIGTRYAVVAIDAIIGLVLLPFNIEHLGQAAWGLWMLTSSLNTYFAAIDLGYGGSLTRFVAQYRARRDAEGMNEILSTVGVVLAGLGVLAYGGFVVAAYYAVGVFNLTPDQVETARWLLLMSGVQVAAGLPFSVFGGVVNGFQRYDLNNLVAVATAVVAAAVNVAVLLAGSTLVELVAALTAVRLASNVAYRFNAYHVFPALSIRPSRFRLERLREVSGFSASVAAITWANRLNYTADGIIIAAFLSPAAVAIWAVPQRLTMLVRSLTNQFSAVLLPVIVDNDTRQQSQHLQRLLIHGTRLSLLAAVPLSACIFVLADRLIPAWVGSGFNGSIAVAQVLALVIVFRVGRTTASVLLKGAGQHGLLAATDATIAVANIGLTLLWIRPFGLAGVAFGTLVPLAVGTALVVWPAACRRLGVGVADATRRAVWPAVWPLPFMLSAMLATRAALPGTVGMMAAAAFGGVTYAAIAFAFAIPPDERAVYAGQFRRIARLPRPRAAAL